MSSEEQEKQIREKRRLPTDTNETGNSLKKSKTENLISFEEFQHQDIVEIPVAGCTHVKCLPPFYSSQEIEKSKNAPAKVFPFELDPFQKSSIACLETNESVLVSAHTSAGKTVVAEYAIAMSFRDHQRVVYTSPIKALSNQKYREFKEEFDDVGLMTGDVTLNPNATCLVMTTEILRNMLYRGSELLREIQWVIFDEIHYMRDKERGVVWEETMILLSSSLRFVFLSATIPNSKQFACWIAKLHNHPCNVIYTEFRPTPLQHYFFPPGGKGLHLVKDDQGNIRHENFEKALAQVSQQEVSVNGKGKKKNSKSKDGNNSSDIYKLVKMILDRKYDPVVIFSFSKRECEAHALQLSKLDFCSTEEKELISSIYQNAIESLAEADRNLPAVSSLLPLLQRGIGIHHGGLLPILKELVEILFQESLLKVLFATETFAMGLNMPCKTVVFTALRKFDGVEMRTISAGEYIQMSGRAGRRGLDDRGLVMVMLSSDENPGELRQMLRGEADPLNSSFKLNYNTVLNLLRVEDTDPEFILQRSFHQYQSHEKAPKLLQRKLQCEERLSSMKFPEVANYTYEDIKEYESLEKQMLEYVKEVGKIRNQEIHIIPFCNQGRLVQVEVNDAVTGWGCIVSLQKTKKRGTSSSYTLNILLKEKDEYQINAVSPGQIFEISTVRLHLPSNIKSAHQKESVGKAIAEVCKRFEDRVPLLDPIQDMHIQDDKLGKWIKRIEKLQNQINSHKIEQLPFTEKREVLTFYREKNSVAKDLQGVEDELRELNQSLLFQTKLKRMKRVLRRLGCITMENVIDLKGRVACEISTAHELLCTQLLFDGQFSQCTPEQLACVCSLLVYSSRDEEMKQLPEALDALVKCVHQYAKQIAEIEQDCELGNGEIEEFVKSFHPGLVTVVYAWSRGTKFSDVCKLTKEFEGSIIRTMRRLVELLNQFVEAAKVMGNLTLQQKFEQSIRLLTRDIVFAGSLYL